MTYHAVFSMPGAFYPDPQNTTAAAVSPTPLFHTSPAAVNEPKSDVTPKRKRARGGLDSPAEEPVIVRNPFGDRHTPRTPRSYTIAGNVDTASAANSGLLDDSIYSESNYRTALSFKRSREESESQQESTGNEPTQLFQLPQEPESPSRGWGASAVSALGSAVGKVWEFCKAGAFKGFYAGGGEGYALSNGLAADHDPIGPSLAAGGDDGIGFSFHPQHFDDYEQRIPGHFPPSQVNHYEPLATSDAPLFQTPVVESRASTPVATKRRHTEKADELGRNWVVINSTASEARLSTPRPRKISGSYRASPRNRNQAASVTTGRRISTPGSASRAGTTASSFTPRYSTVAFADWGLRDEPVSRPVSSASFASPRSPSPKKGLGSAVYLTPSSAHIASVASNASPSSRGHRRKGSAANTPSHRRNHSSASTASTSRGDELDVHASPRLDAEARHLATQRQLDDRNADHRMSAFNKRLQDMIRQGKEALGTTIEIDEGAGSKEAYLDADVWEDED